MMIDTDSSITNPDEIQRTLQSGQKCFRSTRQLSPIARSSILISCACLTMGLTAHNQMLALVQVEFPSYGDPHLDISLYKSTPVNEKLEFLK